MRNLRSFAVLGLIGFFAACQSGGEAPTPPPPAPVAKTFPSVIPANTPENQYSRSFVNLAGYFPRFANEVSRAASNGALATNNSIAESLDATTLYGRSETIDGAKSYAALAAASSPAFRAGILKIGATLGRDQMITNLTTNPNWVRNIEGVDEARNYASSAITSKLNSIAASAEVIHQISYSMQKTPMSKVVMVKDPRLVNIEKNYSAPLPETNFDEKNVQLGTNAVETIDNRILAAAALRMMRADQEALKMLRLGTGSSCATGAKIDLKMCVAATKFSYEHTFCTYEYYQQKMVKCIAENVDDPDEIRRIKAEANAEIARKNAAVQAQVSAKAKPATVAKKPTTSAPKKK